MPGAFARAAQVSVVGVLAAGTATFVVASAVVPFTTDGATPSAHGSHSHGIDSAALHRPATSSTVAPAVSPAAGTAKVPTPLSEQHATAPIDHAAISTLAANGVPTTALNAYRVAATRLRNAEPSCGLQWPLLAGIGRVESDHGQAGGAVLHQDGLSTPRIIGPALTGHGNRYVPAPANGVALDGDAKYAHALGPMQFLPSTWAVYGTDADGDGTADIFDLDDAALAAGRYLCAAGGNLRLHTDRVRAVFAYNNLSSYVAEVLGLARAYRTGVTVTGVPVGELTGSLPPLGQAPAAGLTPAQRARQQARQQALARQRARELERERKLKQSEQHPKTLHPAPTSSAPRSSGGSATPTKQKKKPTSSPTPSPSSSPIVSLPPLP